MCQWTEQPAEQSNRFLQAGAEISRWRYRCAGGRSATENSANRRVQSFGTLARGIAALRFSLRSAAGIYSRVHGPDIPPWGLPTAGRPRYETIGFVTTISGGPHDRSALVRRSRPCRLLASRNRRRLPCGAAQAQSQVHRCVFRGLRPASRHFPEPVPLLRAGTAP